MKHIVVIGGYGQVGSVICKALADIYPKRVIAAGRSFEKARQFSLSTNEKVLPLELDIYNLVSPHEVLKDIELVIMCLDQKDTTFVEMCIQNKVNYLDISPSYTILSKIEQLQMKALEANTTLLLGVGLAPGLSNLMVKKLVSHFDKVKKTDLYLMLGIGEKHGRDGVEWLLNNMNNTYSIFENGQRRKVRSFTEGKYVDLPEKYGKRKAYRFDLADQHIVSKTLELDHVSSRFFYDSVITTYELALLKKLGIFKLLNYHFFKKMFVATFLNALHIFHKLNIGSNDYLIKAEVLGEIEGKECTVSSLFGGANNTSLTGHVASIVGNKFIKNTYPPGVHYMEQLFDLEEILTELNDKVPYHFNIEKPEHVE